MTNASSVKIRYNYWNTIPVKSYNDFIPTMCVSVVVPCYNNSEQLMNLLICLENQTYPHDLFEVIVIDDGSDPQLVLPKGFDFDLKIIYQENDGFRVALARNNGVLNSKYDTIIFLDSDLLIENNHISSHMRWHHCGDNIFTSGQRYHVADTIIDNNVIRHNNGNLSELFDVKKYKESYVWNYYKLHDNLNTKSDEIFHTVIGTNIGINKYYYELIGGFDISFKQWGCEDNEFAYRAYMIGLIIVPILDSLCIHLGLDIEEQEHKEYNSYNNLAKAINLIPNISFRGMINRIIYIIPKFIIQIEYEEIYNQNIHEIILKLLNDKIYDIEIVINAKECDAIYLKNYFSNESRVSFRNCYTKDNLFKYSEFIIRIPNNISIKNNIIFKLYKYIGNNISIRSNIGNNSFISITKTAFINRSYYTNVLLCELGDIKYINKRHLVKTYIELFKVHMNICFYLHKLNIALRNVKDIKTLFYVLKWIISSIIRKIINNKSIYTEKNQDRLNILTSNPKYWNYYHNGKIGYLSTCNDTNMGDFLFIIDDSGSYSNIKERVAKLKELAMRGILVHIDIKDIQINELAQHIDNDLLNLMIAEKTTDHNLRELHSINMRRIAMKDYYVQSIKKNFPLVSILLCTKRTRYLSRILDMIRKQTYPNIEIILGLHGCHVEHIDEIIKNYPYGIKYIYIDEDITLGAALNQLFFNSNGQLITKIDDDDLYGVEHIYDLVLAHKYSHATVVGKNIQFIYLEDDNKLIQRFIGKGESYDSCIAGGTMMISRDDFLFFNGFADIKSSVDTEMTNRIIKYGGNVYATHAYGYVLMRHNIDHTWNVGNDYFEDMGKELDVSFVDHILL